VAPNAKAAAQIYPSNYWLSLMQPPPKSAFPLMLQAPAGTPGAAPTIIESQARWIATMKGCEICHQMGSKATRELSPALGTFDSTQAAWDHRVRMGQVGAAMLRIVDSLGRERTESILADWSDRIAAGEVPQAPPRPQGVERNVVVSLWDIGTPLSFMHDMYATDKRDPTVNAGGLVYAGDYNQGILSVLDPKRNTVESIKVPVIDRNLPPSNFAQPTMQVPSLFFGEELIWSETQRTEVKNVDAKGRLWMMTTFRLADNPAWCKEGSTNKFAQYYPIARSARQMAYYDPMTKQTTLIDTCFGTHHAAYAEDQDDTIFVAGLGSGLSWFKARVFEQAGDAQAAQGWCPAYYDVNGNGRYDKATDKLIATNDYYITYNPKDRSVWYTSPGTPGLIIRMDLGTNPPETCRAEAYAPPFNNPKAPGKLGYLPRGVDADRNGLIWTGLAGSGQLASFDRSKCAVLTGPASFDPQHCAEGWTLYDVPGPQMKNVPDGGSADFLYGNWVDQFDTLGLGKDVPIATGTGSDALLAFMPDTKKWVVLRVPYPLGFYTRNLAGRIDDPKTGWKGRGLWAGNEVRMPWHIEGGKGTTPQAAHFQMRPDPLAH
jgi:hypothetical protein